MSGFKIAAWNADGVERELSDIVAEAMDETLANSVTQAMLRAPVDTGFLKNTIEYQPTRPEGGKLVGRFGNWTADYALWQEIGTRRMAAHPYLRPAADEEFPKLPARIKERMR